MCTFKTLKERNPGIICKLDLEAFDKVDWKFLHYMLGRIGFGEKWRKWIQECISSAWFSTLLNGSPKGYFQAGRGLRQGDPLSPFLFLLVAEAFRKMIKRAVSASLFEGCRVARNSPEISHLQYADDTTILWSSRRSS